MLVFASRARREFEALKRPVSERVSVAAARLPEGDVRRPSGV